MKYRFIKHCLTKLFVLFTATLAGTTPLQDRYQTETSDIGYFGRMKKVLYSADATDTTIATNMVIKKISELIGITTEIKLYLDIEELKLDMSENRLDAVFVNIFDYFAMEHLVNPDYVYALTFGQDSFEKTLLVTRKKQHISRLEDLQGKSITIPSGHLLGRLYLDSELIKRGLPLSEHYFAHINEVEDIHSSIIDLFFGKTDSALVTNVSLETAAELNKQISNELEILLASEEIIPQVIAFNKNMPTATLEQYNRLIIKAHEESHIKNLLSLFRAKKIVKLNKDQMQESRRLLVEYQTMKK
ncbi:MAG: PhnD/SsuA/transferrin family substrate-binding protein [Candidatus Thiodiazotropha sp.]|jgi:ABC-type phosphate/phosphonate transport system substrate-binding protein